MKRRNKLYKQYIQNGRFENDFTLFERLVTEINDLISHTKALYYENLGMKLNIHCCKQKHIVQFLKHFITTKNSSSSTSFDKR